MLLGIRRKCALLVVDVSENVPTVNCKCKIVSDDSLLGR